MLDHMDPEAAQESLEYHSLSLLLWNVLKQINREYLKKAGGKGQGENRLLIMSTVESELKKSH